jgi:PPIC-type PPIASE domain
MQRWVSTLVGLVAVLLAVWLVAHNFHPPKAIGHDPGAHDPGDDAGIAWLAREAGASAPDAAPSLVGLVSDLAMPEVRIDGGVGATMPDGTSVPPLPLGVPRQVRFGVVLVSYAGCQPSVAGLAEGRPPRPVSRSKADAQQLATKLAMTADQDFHAAVQQGDAGSGDDVGRVKLGILEPAPEYVLFTLNVGGVAGPVDTPRGFWIVKRLE